MARKGVLRVGPPCKILSQGSPELVRGVEESRDLCWLTMCGLVSLSLVALVLGGCKAAGSTTTSQAREAEDLSALNEQAVALHRERRLKEASALYVQVLEREPPRESTQEERALVLRYAPRLFVTPTEFFPLKDFAAVLHPEQPLIAYHMFWEDDIDFPDDNDPCDHEVAWSAVGPMRSLINTFCATTSIPSRNGLGKLESQGV